MKLLNVAFLVGAFAASSLLAYPEMVRDGYVNCTTCHVSPNGGGVLTAYGRGLSEALLTTWNKEKEGDFLWGLVKTPEWLSLGGDFRYAQTYRDTPTYTEKRFIFMQADLEAAARHQKFTVLATIGKSEISSPKSVGDALVSHRHFVMYQPTDEIYLRAGRFQKAYGINDPNHYSFTKRGLGWDQNTETYNIEGAYLGEKYDVFVTGILGRPDNTDLKREKGLALRSSYNFGESTKVGVSYFYGTNDAANRHVFGPYGILGFSKRFFLLSEIDFQSRSPKTGASQFGWVHYYRLDYEVIQGLHVFLTEEITKLDFKDTRTLMHAPGIGIQFFPRPHFEVYVQYQKIRADMVSTSFYDFAWIMLHTYL